MPLSGIKKPVGRDFNFFQKITVTWNSFGNGSADGYSPDMFITFPTTGIMLLNEDAVSVVECSFNGTTVHDELSQVAGSKDVSYDNRRISKIYFRLKSGSSAIISVRAW